MILSSKNVANEGKLIEAQEKQGKADLVKWVWEERKEAG